MEGIKGELATEVKNLAETAPCSQYVKMTSGMEPGRPLKGGSSTGERQ